MPEKNRVLLTSTQYFHEHYIKEPFDSGDRQEEKHLRPRDKTAELRGQMTYAFGMSRYSFAPAHENARIVAAIAAGRYNTEPIDSKILINPQWRPANRKKFLTEAR